MTQFLHSVRLKNDKTDSEIVVNQRKKEPRQERKTTKVKIRKLQ